MCVILVGKASDLKEHIEDAMLANPHGAGIAWCTSASSSAPFRWKKGLWSAEEALAILASLGGDADAVFHARIGTAGGNSPSLTHPFPVEVRPSLNTEGDTDMLLFQNGHLAEWEQYVGEPPGDDWSDTRAIAHAIATGRITLGEAVGGKLLVMHTLDGSPGYVALGAGWVRLGRVLASNDHFVGYKRYVSPRWEYREKSEPYVILSPGDMYAYHKRKYRPSAQERLAWYERSAYHQQRRRDRDEEIRAMCRWYDRAG